jgi:chemotaxis-related protein WspD
VLFRIGSEWLGLPTTVVTEVADVRPIRTLPHRRGGAVLGVVNIRGELVVCVSLARLLGAAPAQQPNEKGSRLTLERLLVLRRGDVRAACPADEVHGIHHFDGAQLVDVPATVGRAGSRHSKAVAEWNGRSVGVLDDQLLLQTVQRSLA